MNVRNVCKLGAALFLLAGSFAAHALPSLTLYPHPAAQAGTTKDMRVGLTVEGRTAWYSLTVAGGFTVQCEGVGLTLTAERALPTSSMLGNLTLFVTVPEWVPATYEILGWPTLSTGTCRQCTFQYKGQAVDSADATISGSGVSFTLNVGGTSSNVNTQIFNVCRYRTGSGAGGGGPTGCIP